MENEEFFIVEFLDDFYRVASETKFGTSLVCYPYTSEGLSTIHTALYHRELLFIFPFLILLVKEILLNS